MMIPKLIPKNVFIPISDNTINITTGIPILIKINIIFINTLALCLTTAVGDDHSNLGKYKFMIIPIVAERKQYNTDITRFQSISIIENLSPIANNILANITAGTVIVKQSKILLRNMLFSPIGKDFAIHKFLPSNDIDDGVVEERPMKNIISPNIKSPILLLIPGNPISVAIVFLSTKKIATAPIIRRIIPKAVFNT